MIPSHTRRFADLLRALFLLAVSASAAGDQPNIIVAFFDDVGTETIGEYGADAKLTPRIDALAREGLRFEYGHAQPLCTPSRIKLMTGLSNARNYSHFGYLDPEAFTFAHLLKNAGYNTAVVGKWQLSNTRTEVIGTSPEQAGFDEYLLWQLDMRDVGSRYWSPVVTRNGVLEQHGDSVFGPDLFSDYVVEYIKSGKNRPFFLYYPMVLAHDPWVITPDMLDRAATDKAKHNAMITYMDKLVGRMHDAVLNAGLAENTYIFLIGDNGTHRTIISRVAGARVRGGKGTTTRQGTRVPFIVWGPSLIEGGRVSNDLVDVGDILPTLADLANSSPPESSTMDGVSLLPVMQNKDALSRDALYMYYKPWENSEPIQFVYDKRFKLYADGDFFDMDQDPEERAALDLEMLDSDTRSTYRRLQRRLESHISSDADNLPLIMGSGLLAIAGVVLAVAVFILIMSGRPQP